MAIGCLKIDLNNENLYVIWKTLKIIKLNKIGSVGNAISTSKLKLFNSDNGIDNGVKKNKGNKMLLKFAREDKTTPAQKGKINNK